MNFFLYELSYFTVGLRKYSKQNKVFELGNCFE